MSGGSCGGCTLCCTVMKVSFAPEIREPKPAGEPCPHQCKGCGIYDNRPNACRVFECVWLASFRFAGKQALPMHERPDRTGMVLEANSKGTIIAHLATPEAWRRPVNYDRLMFFNRVTNVTIEHGDGRVSVLEKNGTTTELEYLDTADNGEKRYVRPNHPLSRRHHENAR